MEFYSMSFSFIYDIAIKENIYFLNHYTIRYPDSDVMHETQKDRLPLGEYTEALFLVSRFWLHRNFLGLLVYASLCMH